MKQIKLSILCLLVLSDVVQAANLEWPGKTAHVIKLIYDTIKAHHPGVLDQKNPHFLDDLERDYQNANNLSHSVQNFHDLIAIAEQFANNDYRRTSWHSPDPQPKANIHAEGKAGTGAKIEIRGDIIEAHFPTFKASTDDDEQAMNEQIASLKKHVREQKFKTLIINFKGNHNVGSSRWGNEIFKAVWGERVHEIVMSQHQNEVFYRITPENNAHMKWALSKPTPEEYKKRYIEIEQRMEQALQSGATSKLLAYRQEFETIKEALPPIGFSVEIHTDGTISRAVRPFLGMALRASAKIIGKPIPPCSPYSEVRDIEIFEGHKLRIPIAGCYEDNVAFEPSSL